MTYRKKLIEVALPLEAINVASAREKSIRHGHPSTLHLWWARRPLAACRAVLFSSLVDDPSEYMPDEESARIERERLFNILEDLVIWENSNNEEVLDRAKLEIARSVARNLGVDVPVGKEAIGEFLATKAPPVLDPFAGGGSIPLEAQRLGLRAYASDLNPVAVLINKALIEIPPKFANMSPVHPDDGSKTTDNGQSSIIRGRKKKTQTQPSLFTREWKGAQGLAEDVRYYGKWMREEAYKRIGHLYPPVTITKEMLEERPDLKEQGYKTGDQFNVIAWLWARTVICPNPACRGEIPLLKSFWLSKKGTDKSWVEPILNSKSKKVQFNVKYGKPSNQFNLETGTSFVNEKGKSVKATAYCLFCNSAIKGDFIDIEANKDNIHLTPIAIVAEASNGRIYLPFQYDLAQEILKQSKTEKENSNFIFPDEPSMGTFGSNAQGRTYGFRSFSDYFTDRQLLSLAAFTETLNDLNVVIHSEQQNIEISYSKAIRMYLAFALDKGVNLWSSLVSWMNDRGAFRETFARQAIPFIWDFAEANPFSQTGGGVSIMVDRVADAISFLPASPNGKSEQHDATKTGFGLTNLIVSTDPPYYGNIGYAHLSDYFYVWLRRFLGNAYPGVFATLLTPKNEELVVTPFKFDGDRQKAEAYFQSGMKSAFSHITSLTHPDFPITVYYALKQQEEDEETSERIATGWEKMLQAMIDAQLLIDGTWPINTESEGRSVAIGSNALASSIILVCRPRSQKAVSISRREFLSTLKKELAPALRELQQGNIAPVDLAQAAIGPGMAVFSRYSAVLEADGKSMSVRTALTLINHALDEYLSEQEGEYDGDTRWALSWYEQFGHNEAAFGVAETLSKAKNTSVNGLVEAGILEARGGKVRLLGRDELDHEWDPTEDKRPTAWEAVQHLIYALENEGEESAAGLLAKLGSIAEPARDLAYRLYTVCERKGWAQDALGYNMLVVAWPRLKELAAKQRPMQENLL